MITASAFWTDRERFIGIASSGHAVVIDAAKEKTGPSPMEFVLMGLCSCTAVDIVSILRKKREPFTSVEVLAEAERAPEPPMVYTKIKLVYCIGGEVSAKAVEHAVRLSEEKYCSVAGMLRKTATITTEIKLLDRTMSQSGHISIKK
jgi:putative redox protein